MYAFFMSLQEGAKTGIKGLGLIQTAAPTVFLCVQGTFLSLSQHFFLGWGTP